MFFLNIPSIEFCYYYVYAPSTQLVFKETATRWRVGLLIKLVSFVFIFFMLCRMNLWTHFSWPINQWIYVKEKRYLFNSYPKFT